MDDIPITVDDDLTPVSVDACPGCGRTQYRVAARAPEAAAAAWGRAGPELRCYRGDAWDWTWCSGTGDLTYISDDSTRIVVSFERRFRRRPAADDPGTP